MLVAGALLLGGAASVGAPATATAVSCEGDECQGPPPAPEEVIPATAVVEGPANPPARFPHSSAAKHKKKKHHHKRRRGGRR